MRLTTRQIWRCQIWLWLRPGIRCADRGRQGDPKAPPALRPSPKWRKARDLRTRLSHGSVSKAVHKACAWYSLAGDAAGLGPAFRLPLPRRRYPLAATWDTGSLNARWPAARWWWDASRSQDRGWRLGICSGDARSRAHRAVVTGEMSPNGDPAHESQTKPRQWQDAVRDRPGPAATSHLRVAEAFESSRPSVSQARGRE